MTRVLVTAALGNVGREVVRACAARGLTVRAGHTRADALVEQFPRHEAVRLDFLDRRSWSDALNGCDFVFLLRPPRIAEMETTLIPFIEAAYAAGVKHLVFLSVAGADRMKWVPHRKVELHLERVSDAWTVLRPGFFAQNLQDAYRQDITEDHRLYVPAANGRVAFLDVRDAAEVAARIFEEPTSWQRQALTLTGPEAVTFEAVAEVLSKELGRKLTYRPASIPGYPGICGADGRCRGCRYSSRPCCMWDCAAGMPKRCLLLSSRSSAGLRTRSATTWLALPPCGAPLRGTSANHGEPPSISTSLTI